MRPAEDRVLNARPQCLCVLRKTVAGFEHLHLPFARMPRSPALPSKTSNRSPVVTALAIVFAAIASPASDKYNPPSARLIASPEPDWPQFRGPRRDGISDERGLLPSWPPDGPKKLWSAEGLGRGYSSPVIVGDRIFITGDRGEELHIFALDLSGRIIWQTKNGASWKDQYPGARASVTYRGGRIYHENAHGRVACLDAKTGKELWAVNLLERFGGQNITWGLSECLLVDERAVYAMAGGSEALLVALDPKTGDVIWKSEPLRDAEGDHAIENASYVSPILVQFGKRRLLVGASLKHVFCADAETGKLQWTRRMPTAYSVIAMMPVLIGDAIFMTAPQGKGGRLFHLVPPTTPDGLVGMKEGWSTSLDTLQGGAVLVGGKLFGAFYPGRKGWAAVDARTGAVLYQATGLVKGAGLYAEERLYALCEDGTMLLLQPGEKGFETKGSFRVAEVTGSDAWAHPVIHQGRLYLRYHETLSCYDVRRQ